jgi:2'-5' RNA ligase
VSLSEGAQIDVLMSNDPETEETITDEVNTFAEALSRKAEEGNFTMSIGSTYAPHSTLLTVTSDDNCSDNQLEEPEKSEEDQWDDMEDTTWKRRCQPRT